MKKTSYSVYKTFCCSQWSTFVDESAGGDIIRDLDDPKVSLTNWRGEGAVLLVLRDLADISTEFFRDRSECLFSTDSANEANIIVQSVSINHFCRYLISNGRITRTEKIKYFEENILERGQSHGRLPVYLSNSCMHKLIYYLNH